MCEQCGQGPLPAHSQAEPLDPLALHRSFCPWVCQEVPREGGDRGGSSGGAAGTAPSDQGGQQPGRCGWAWCLQQLVPGAEDGPGLAAGSKQFDPAKLLREVLSRVEVHK